MKYLLISLMLAVSLPVHAESKTKKVCHVDEKTKKEQCKTIKVHHKAEKVTEGSPTDPEPKKSKK